VRALVLDFDGVISDSAREAFALALRTHCELRPGCPLRSVLARLDPARPEGEPLYAGFLELMPLGNRAEDYAVALRALESGRRPADQAAYDAFKAELDAGELRAFHTRFYEERERWSRGDPEGWLRLLPPFPGFVEVLRRRGGEVELAIATSKDRRSVGDLLRHYGLAPLFGPGRVLDKEQGASKRVHLELFARSLGIPCAEMTFVDDKVSHLESAAGLGVRCVLAAWGYNGGRERERAREQGFLVCGLDDVEAALFGR
jgi:phosphoglycolate phosphatase-like HAD superfamily hydrolase